MRILALAGGLAGAMALSQFPEFSQQYVQRLAGATDELRAVAIAFDTTARVAGLSREQALDAMGGTDFQDRLRDDMRARIYRYERLNADYQALAGAAPLQRLARFWHLSDLDLAERTWADFRPAVPVTAEGAIFGAIGFAGGWGIMSLLLGLFIRPRRRARLR